MASLHALDQIFQTVLKQPVVPVQVTDYIEKVLDWRSFAVAREIGGSAGQDWLVRGNGQVRELHWMKNDAPLLTPGNGVTGYATGTDGTYIHIADGEARIAFGSNATNASLPYIAQANGFVRDFKRDGRNMSFHFGGYYQPFVELANAQSCRVSIDGHAVATRRDGNLLRFDTAGIAATQMQYRPVEVACGN